MRKGSQLRSDYRKSRIEVEVQFGNVARYAYDVLEDGHRHGPRVFPMWGSWSFAPRTSQQTSLAGISTYYERAVRELERSRLTLIVPLVVIGIEPESWSTSAYPPESDAPEVTARTINAPGRCGASHRSPKNLFESDGLAVEVLRSLAYRLAG